jgi:heavy metal response regulator
MRILVVEDEKKVAGFIKKGLEEEGYVVDVAHSGEEGLDRVFTRNYHVIVLDINLPGMDGLAVLKKIRQKSSSLPVLLLTVRAAIEDKVFGLDEGADDYLAKPFAFQELVARVRALARRKADAEPSELRIADLALDPLTRSAQRGEKEIELTAKEYMLLAFLIRNQGRVLSRTVIADSVWGYDFDTGTNVIDVYINYLRKKVDADHDVKLIHTVRGVGYVMKVQQP